MWRPPLLSPAARSAAGRPVLAPFAEEIEALFVSDLSEATQPDLNPGRTASGTHP